MKQTLMTVTSIRTVDHAALTDQDLAATLTEVNAFQLDARDLPGPRSGLTDWVAQAPLCFRSRLEYRGGRIEIAFFPERQRAGVAVGTYTEWTACANEVEALRRFLNDDMRS